MEQLTDGFQANAFDFLKQFLSLASNGKSAMGTDKGDLVIGYSKSTKKLFSRRNTLERRLWISSFIASPPARVGSLVFLYS